MAAVLLSSSVQRTEHQVWPSKESSQLFAERFYQRCGVPGLQAACSTSVGRVATGQVGPSTHRHTVRAAAGGSGTDGRQGIVGFSDGVGTLAYTPASAAPGGAEGALPAVPWWREWQKKNRRLQAQLQSYGMSGVVAYGLCNTLYYTFAFLFIWLYVAQVPRGLGLAGAGRRFVEVMSLTWAYSQVTKLGRAGAALALAPIVDGCLLVIQCRLGLRSRAATFWLVVGVMLTFAAVLIGGVVAIWS